MYTIFLLFICNIIFLYNFSYDRPKLSCSDVYCHFAIPETLLNAVDMKQANYWFCLIVLVALYVMLDIGTYTLLKLKLEKRV